MIQVIERVSEILQYISDKGVACPLSEIADNLGINRATCANILKSLKDTGLIEQEEYRGGYLLGDKLYSLVGQHNDPDRLLKTLKPLLESLCLEVNENVMLAVIRNDKRILLHSVKAEHQIEAQVIYEMPAWYVTTARVILARYSPEKLNNFIKIAGMPGKFWPGISSRRELIEALNAYKENECTTVVNDHFACIAAPIYKNGEVIASIGYYLPDIRLTPESKIKLESALINATHKARQLLDKDI